MKVVYLNDYLLKKYNRAKHKDNINIKNNIVNTKDNINQCNINKDNINNIKVIVFDVDNTLYNESIHLEKILLDNTIDFIIKNINITDIQEIINKINYNLNDNSDNDNRDYDNYKDNKDNIDNNNIIYNIDTLNNTTDNNTINKNNIYNTVNNYVYKYYPLMIYYLYKYIDKDIYINEVINKIEYKNIIKYNKELKDIIDNIDNRNNHIDNIDNYIDNKNIKIIYTNSIKEHTLKILNILDIKFNIIFCGNKIYKPMDIGYKLIEYYINNCYNCDTYDNDDNDSDGCDYDNTYNDNKTYINNNTHINNNIEYYFIDDKEINLLSARNNGWNTYLVNKKKDVIENIRNFINDL